MRDGVLLLVALQTCLARGKGVGLLLLRVHELLTRPLPLSACRLVAGRAAGAARWRRRVQHRRQPVRRLQARRR